MKLFLNIVVALGAVVVLYDAYRKNLAGRIVIDRDDLQKNVLYRITKRISPYLFYVLIAAVLALQFSLTFDNVLWGDEAFSANTVRLTSYSGILQIIHFSDPHPPLYYFWLETWTLLFGQSGWLMHMASYFWYFVLCVFAATIFRKRYGKLSASFLIIFTGFARICAEYVQEIRMYELAFVMIIFCLYSLDMVLRTNKFLYWIPAVIFALGGAYSHYYALMLAGILLFLATIVSQIRFGGKTFLKGIGAMALFVIGYLPWIGEVLYRYKEQTGHWWMTANSPANECMEILFGSKAVLPPALGILLVGTCIMLAKESEAFAKTLTTPEKYVIRAPKVSGWSVELWLIVMGICAVLIEVVIVVIASKLVVPMLAKRYLYPSTALTAYLLAISVSGGLRDLSKKLRGIGKTVMSLVLILFLVVCLGDFRDYRAEVKQQSAATEAVLGFINERGAAEEDLVFVNNGVSHIGWTVLNYYYPEAEVINGGYDSSDADDLWVFSAINIDQETIDHMRNDRGYTMDDYGIQQIAKYPCFLYHFYR